MCRELIEKCHWTPTYVTHELPVTVLIGLSEAGSSGGLTREEAMARHHERLRQKGLLPPETST